MKNIISFIIVFALLAVTFYFYDVRCNAYNFFVQGECEFIVAKQDNLKEFPEQVRVVENGGNLIINAPVQLGRYLHNTLKSIKGVTFYLDESLQSVTKRLKVKYFSGSEIEGAKHYYGFCPSFEEFVFVAGKKVNMHFVEKQGQLIIGLPIILGSY